MMHFSRRTRGFTLIELIVSVGLFSIVMTIVASSYLSLLSRDRQARATNDVANNLNFVLDTMARSIRTGTNYYCGVSGGPNCAATPQSTFSFLDDQGNTVTYSLSAGGQILECYNSGTGCVATPITDSRIVVDTLNFYARGIDTGNGDQTQPEVTLVMHGKISADTTHTVFFTIQTSATQRLINI
jgi:prepilin-type N-terminal cleavage/methylation domain-containing protein